MAKILQRLSSQDERDQAGCVWGLISRFDFRRGRSTRRLLGDRRRPRNLSVDSGSSRLQTGPSGRCQDFEDSEESNMIEAEVVKTSVKELMNEEIFNVSKNHANEFEINFPHIDSEHRPHFKKNHKQRNKKYRTTSVDMDVSKLDTAIPENFHKVPQQMSSDIFDLQLMMDELSWIHQKSTSNTRHDRYDDLSMPSGLEFSILEAKLVEATKVFIEYRLSNNSENFGEEGKTHCSKELIDALQTLSSNKALFMKLLQDPNSVLVKQIQKLENVQLEKRIRSKSVDLVNGRHRRFFQRRKKTLESYPLEESKNDQASSKIVILKPSSVQQKLHTDDDRVHYAMDDKERDGRNTSQFSFTKISRKLRHAVGKERREISPDRLILRHQNVNNSSESSSRESVSWSSPNRDHFYIERFGKPSTGYKRSEHVGKSKDRCLNEMSQNPRKGVSKIYTEAKKHLSEMLNNEDNNTEPVSWQLPKSLGRILSLPEYNSSPCYTPREYNSEIRLSPGIINDINPPRPCKQNLESQIHSSTGNPTEKFPSLDSEDYLVESQCHTECVTDPKDSNSCSSFLVTEDSTNPRPHEEETNTIPLSTVNSVGRDGQNGRIDKVDDGVSSFQCLKSDSFGRDGLFSSPTFFSQDVENHETTTDKTEGPSPVSVLEPLFAENDISPMSSVSQQDEKEIQPMQLQFEEQSSASNHGICSITSMEDQESAYDYVEAVLFGSGLNWDEYLMRWLSLYEILHPSLFDEVELFPGQSCHDQKLLFDCTNQVLKEVCENYFGCFTISYTDLNIRPVPEKMDLIQDVWKRVEFQLFQRHPPNSLDQVIKKDMAKPGKWMNIRADIEHIGIEMEDAIFDELVEDVILSFADYVISWCKFEGLPAETGDMDSSHVSFTWKIR